MVVCLAGIQWDCPINIFDVLLYGKLNSQDDRQVFFDLTKLFLKKLMLAVDDFFFSYLSE